MAWVCSYDLETVPDYAALCLLHGLAEDDHAGAAEKIGDKFQKHALHSIACIGVLLAERVDDHWEVRSLGAPHIGDRSEAELITGFVERIEALRPALISFNGNGFDLPVLRYRAMVHSIPAPGLHARPYFKRYDDSAVDLLDVLGSFSPQAKIGLDDLCCILGLPGKPEGVDGSKVAELVQQGRIAEVSHYCQADVVATYRVWLRFELFRGGLTKAGFEASEASVIEFIQARVQERPYLGFMIEGASSVRWVSQARMREPGAADHKGNVE